MSFLSRGLMMFVFNEFVFVGKHDLHIRIPAAFP
jgi:hypothetical protein